MDTCRSLNLATRATILATELFCQTNRHIDAANLFIRLTGDDSDLRSALFLEQASKCFLTVSPFAARNTASQLTRSASTQSLLSVMSKSTNIETVGPFGARYRKAAFHYILAGHRYNRCGLKHFALTCYRRFNYPFWEAASDHVNLTVAKLFATISASNVKKCEDYYLRGLDIYRACSHKQIFFAELFRELKKYHSSGCDLDTVADISPATCPELYRLEIPFIHQFLFISLDSLQPQEYSFKSKNQRHACFVDEQIEICFTMSAPFPLSIGNLKLICDARESVLLATEFTAAPVTFESANQLLEITLKLTPQSESEFSLLGFEYSVENVPLCKHFSERMRQALNFKAIRTLPLIPIDIAIPELGLDALAVNQSKHAQNSILMIPGKVYGSEKIILRIETPTTTVASNWSPSSIHLFTSAKQFYPWPANATSVSILADNILSPPEDESPVEEFKVPIQFGQGPLDVQIHIPPKVDRHLVSFRLVYVDGESKQSRTILRKLSFEVVPCLDLEAKFGSVATLRNLLPTEPIAIFDVTCGDDQLVAGATDPADASYVPIPVDHAAHVLLLKTFFRWTLPNTMTQSNTSLPGTVRNGMILFS